MFKRNICANMAIRSSNSIKSIQLLQNNITYALIRFWFNNQAFMYIANLAVKG